eukprot:4498476-Amphidinium_carterae.2
MENMLKKHLAAAQDSPALQSTLKEALLAVQQQKRDALSLSDKRAHFCAQIRALSAKMDQHTKIVQEATEAREQLKEELITVCLRLEKLPSEELPVPKLAAAPSYTGQGEPAQHDGLGNPAPTPATLLTLMACAKNKAREEDEEAQRVYDQLSDAPAVQQMLEHHVNMSTRKCS